MSWRTLVILAVAVGTGVPGVAQLPQRISLADALRLHAANNLELRLARAQAAGRIGEARMAGATPNPAVVVAHESLHDGGREAGETYLTLEQEFVWPWVIGARRGAVRYARAAASAQLEADSLRLVFDVARAYVDAWFLERQLAVTHRVVEVFRSADAAVVERYAAGDASGYELRRIQLERLRYERLLAEGETRAGRANRWLTRLVLPEGEMRTVAPRGMPDPPEQIDFHAGDEAVEAHALVRAARARLEEAEEWASAASGQRLPAPSLTGGYKTQRDGFGGVFLGAALPLPMFNRQSGAVQAAAAGTSAALARLDLARRAVRLDFSAAHERLRLAEVQWQRTGALEHDEPVDLLDVARVSYAEGEVGLFGLLDAARAYQELGAAGEEALAQYWLALFDLERAVGRPLVTDEPNGRRP